MQAFDDVIYMDVQKTGSTAITRFLRLNLAYEQRHSDKHARLTRDPQPGEIFLISLRDPVDLWISLYNYGCDGRGALHKRLTESGIAAALYTGTLDGCHRWLELCLSLEGAQFLAEDFAHYQHLGLGFQSFRFLVMALPRPVRSLAAVRGRGDVVPHFESQTMVHHLIRTSSLEADLLAVAQGPLAQRLRPGALDQGGGEPPVRKNSSTAHVRPEDLSPEITALIREREWFLEHVAATWVDRPHAG